MPRMEVFRRSCAAARARWKDTRLGRRLVAQEYVAEGEFAPAIEKLFANAEISYLQVHSATRLFYLSDRKGS